MNTSLGSDFRRMSDKSNGGSMDQTNLNKVIFENLKEKMRKWISLYENSQILRKLLKAKCLYVEYHRVLLFANHWRFFLKMHFKLQIFCESKTKKKHSGNPHGAGFSGKSPSGCSRPRSHHEHGRRPAVRLDSAHSTQFRPSPTTTCCFWGMWKMFFFF